MPSRFSKCDWLELGLKTLAKQGASSIRIDTLCALAGRTKGSFYHHFKTRDDFVSALLCHWEDTLTQNIIDQTNQESGAVERLMMLSKITTNLDGGVERELRRWAGTDTVVEAAINAVDKRRVDYVASLLMQAKNITSQKAIDLAVLNYTSLIGFQQMFAPVHKERRQRIEKIFVDLLGTLPDHL